MSSSIVTLLDYIEKVIAELHVAITKRSLRKTRNEIDKLTVFSDCLKSDLPEKFAEATFADFNRHLHFVKYFLEKRDFEWIRSNFDDIKDRDLPKIKSEILEHIEKRKVSKIRTPVKPKVPKKETPSLSNRVFVVHGKDKKSLEELKTMLREFKLNPIVLHEQPSGSRTIVEKLERYSDVGYAFVILTPDDIGGSFRGKIPVLGTNMLEESGLRARQNVILEFGYFIGKLGRDRVCCLYKGDVELPSDMHGIVYIPFKDSVEEARDMVIKELKEADYEIKL